MASECDCRALRTTVQSLRIRLGGQETAVMHLGNDKKALTAECDALAKEVTRLADHLVNAREARDILLGRLIVQGVCTVCGERDEKHTTNCYTAPIRLGVIFEQWEVGAMNEFQEVPSHWEPHYNASSEPCDMISGPCCCGAWHALSELWVKKGIASDKRAMEANDG